MKKTIKLISLAIVAMMLISLVACNRSNETVDDAADNESIVLNEAINKTESEEDLQKHTEGVEAAKNMLVINSNGIVEESKRAAAAAGIYNMPDPIFNGASAGTYPIQGFLLSASTPSDQFGNGMSIVYRLSDGSLFVFDGGGPNVKHMLYKCLKDISGGGKIKVAAWVMTHTHGDHYGAMYDLLNGIYKYDFEIQEFWYNRATNTSDGTGSGVHLERLFNELAVGDTQIRVLEYGQTYTLDGGRVSAKVLCTPVNVADKIGKVEGADENTNSLVMMLTIGGKRILMTGDANKVAWDFMVSQHNKSEEYSLKCDYLQMPHHAVQAAGTTAGYNAANPSYVIIPSTTALAKSLCTSSNANPTYNFLKNSMGINTQASGLAQVGNNYCYAGNYTQSGTKNVVCFFTSVA